MPDPLNRLLATLSSENYAGVSDSELLSRAVVREDHVALELLVRRHAGLVWRVCSTVTRDRHAAEDAFQATFLALLRKPSVIRGQSAAGWLHRVAYRVSQRTFDRRPLEALRDLPSGCPGPTEVAEQAEMAAAAIAALSQLPDKYRVPVILCHLQGYSQAEAAQQLGLPLGTVAVRVMRGLEQLRKLLKCSPFALATCIGLAREGELYATPSPLISRACELAAGTVSPSPKVAALTAFAVASDWSKYGIPAVVMCALASFGIAIGASGTQEPATLASSLKPSVSSASTIAKEAKPELVRQPNPAFLVYRVSTDLQRRLLGKDMSDGTVVFVGRSAVCGASEKAVPEEVALTAIRQTLVDDKFAKDRPILFYCPKLDSRGPHDRRPDLVAEPLIQLGLSAKFTNVRFTHVPGTLVDDWDVALREATSSRSLSCEEPGISVGDLVVYPVRTTLSRLLCGGTDCVVAPTALGPLNRNGEVLMAAQRAIDAAGLPARNSVLVLITSHGDEDREFQKRLGESLGFGRVLTRFGPDPFDNHGRGPFPSASQ